MLTAQRLQGGKKKSAQHLKISPSLFVFFSLQETFKPALSLIPSTHLGTPAATSSSAISFSAPNLTSSQKPSLKLQIKLTTAPLTCKGWTLKGSFKCKCHPVTSSQFLALKSHLCDPQGKARKSFLEAGEGTSKRCTFMVILCKVYRTRNLKLLIEKNKFQMLHFLSIIAS